MIELHEPFENVDIDYKVFVINLDRSPQRLERISAQLEAEEIEFTRLPAVDGFKVTITNVAKNETFTGLQLKNEKASLELDTLYKINCNANYHKFTESDISFYYTFRYGFMPNAGALGCSCSHIMLWNHIINSNIDYAVVLEDDAILQPDFKQNLLKSLRQLEEDWKILYLGVNKYSHGDFYTPFDKENIIIANNVNNIMFGSHGYVINPFTAIKLVIASTKSDICCSDMMLYEVLYPYRYAVWKTREDIVATETMKDSVISSMGFEGCLRGCN